MPGLSVLGARSGARFLSGRSRCPHLWKGNRDAPLLGSLKEQRVHPAEGPTHASPGWCSGHRASLSLQWNHRPRMAEAGARSSGQAEAPLYFLNRVSCSPSGRFLEKYRQRYPGLLFQYKQQNKTGLWSHVGASAGFLQEHLLIPIGWVPAHLGRPSRRLLPQLLIKTQPSGQQGVNPDDVTTTAGQGGWGACPGSYALQQGRRGISRHRGP